MKLKINKACDLSSISVLPPRRSGGMSSGTDASGLGKSQASQLRSQSQQSFSQGVSLSQLSQTSLEENIMNDQRFGLHDNSSKRISSLASGSSSREESQMQLSRASNNTLHRWNPTSVPDSRCQVNEELEHKFRLIESSINRIGMVLDSVQNDVMQVNRAVKEVSLETEGIRQKVLVLDNSMQKMIKAEDDIKSFLDGSLKSIPDQLIKISNSDKLDEISLALSALPHQIETCFLKLQHENFRVITKEMEAILNSIKSFSNKSTVPIQLPGSRTCTDTNHLSNSQIPVTKVLAAHLTGYSRSVPVPKVEEGKAKALQPKLTGPNHIMALKREDISISKKDQDFRVIIDSDDESDGGASCLIVKKKKAEKESCWMKEATEDTLRILRQARKRRRRKMNSVIFV
ncbi:protein PAIR1 isoform X1 [Typha latifolia]|uniref:protein PAIR1 isoform X1 n=1 Tax=Typha latifolia TaxID=4733 RepID=UPI003C2FD247